MSPARWARRLGVGLLAAGLSLVACTTTEAPPEGSTTTPDIPVGDSDPTATDPPDGGTLRYALGGNPQSIDPRFVADEEGLTVVDALFDSLVAIDEDLQTIVPAAAEEWEVSDNRRVYRFDLREGAEYHDGTPVVAGDFVRSFRRIVERGNDPESFLFYQLEPVVGYEAALEGGQPLRGVRAVDRHTLEIRLRRPTAEFLQVLAHPSLAPVPPAASEDPASFEDQPVGNGPFAMAEPWQPNQFIRVTRFADHASRARLEEVVFQIYADDPSRQQQYDDFRDGRVDVAQVPPDQLTAARAEYGRSPDGVSGPGVVDGVTGTVYYYGFNTELPPFDDPAVRRALSLLVDRERIVEEVLLDTRVAATALVPPSLPGGESGLCDLCRFDADAARDVLGVSAEQGSGPPIPGPLEIVYNPGTTNERIARLVARDVEAALGVQVGTRSVGLEQLVGQLREGQVGIFRLGWTADYPSPGAILQPLFRSDSIGQDNLTRFSHEQVDRLLTRARREADRERRLQLYQEAEELILQQAPVAPIFFYRNAWVVADGVQDLRIGPLGDVSLADAWKLPDA